MNDRRTLSLHDASVRFAVEPGYLDSASIGAPPNESWGAMQDALGRWRAGRARPQDYDVHVSAARAAFARLVGVTEHDVCIGSQVSALIGLVAASLPASANVLVAENDFTSLLFPFLAQGDRGVTVSFVPLQRLADRIDVNTDLVAVSAVQSATGELADLEAIRSAAATHGTRTLIDATQACGWLPIDARSLDYVVCAAYKWLLAPRGTAFMAIQPALVDTIRPNSAGWYAGEDIWSSIYGGPLRLASTARRLDVSPAWLSWVGTTPSLELLEAIGVEAIRSHNVELANRFRIGLGLPPSNSAIVSVAADNAADRLRAAGIRASTRAGAARLAFHLYNTETDADRAITALT